MTHADYIGLYTALACANLACVCLWVFKMPLNRRQAVLCALNVIAWLTLTVRIFRGGL